MTSPSLSQPAAASPFAAAARDLIALGYHPLPIIPGEKRPGEYKGGEWRGLVEWQRFRDRPPSEFELRLWETNWPQAGLGMVMGVRSGDLALVAVDVDTQDADELDAILRTIPHSPMRKTAKKGETRYFLAPATMRTRSYKIAGRTLVDLLTGAETRQTVAPPSVHPDGAVYRWLDGPIALSELPLFDEDALAELEETLASLGWGAEPEQAEATPRPVRDADDPPTIWRERNDAALANLSAWAPELDLYGLRPARGGYEAVATWRESGTGRPVEQRKRNLKIHATGIRDMGDGRAYTPIDLVMQAQGWDQPRAYGWLGERLGIAPAQPILLQPARALAVAEGEAIVDAGTGEAVRAPLASNAGHELPDNLLHPPGIVGDLVDWITATAQRPSRAMALGAALTIVGTAAGRQFCGPTRTGTHLYVLSLAPTGAGKDHPLKAIQRVLYAANMQAHLGPSEFISMPAAIKFLCRSPLSVCPMDEFGAFLKRINNRRASGFEGAISGVLRRAWGCSFDPFSTPEWAQVASQTVFAPALSLYGASTAEEFYQSLADGDATNGVLNRFLVVETRERPAARPRGGVLPPVPDHVIAALRDIYEGGGMMPLPAQAPPDMAIEPIVVGWADAGAESVHDTLLADLEARMANDDPESALYGRTAEMAQRMATIVALGRDGRAARLTAADMAWGRDVALWSAECLVRGAREHMAENDFQAKARLVLNVIRSSPNGICSRTRLYRGVNQRLATREVDGIIAGLIEAGQIAENSVRKQGPGRPSREYVYLSG